MDKGCLLTVDEKYPVVQVRKYVKYPLFLLVVHLECPVQSSIVQYYNLLEGFDIGYCGVEGYYECYVNDVPEKIKMCKSFSNILLAFFK